MKSHITLLILLCLLPLACKKKEVKGDAGSKGGQAAIKLPDEIVRKLESLRKAGEPTTVAELRRWVADSSPATNAAPLYQIAFAQLPAVGSPGRNFLRASSNLPPRNATMPKATLDALAKFCTENAALLDSLHVATQVKECMYPIELKDDVYGTLVPHVGKVKSCAQALATKAYLEVERGQTAQAVDSICSQVAVSESLARDPLLIGQVVRMACVPITGRTLERLLNRRSLTAGQLDQLQQTLQQVNYQKGLRLAILSERCASIVVYQTPPEVFDKFLGENKVAAGVNPESMLESAPGTKRSIADSAATNQDSRPKFDWQGYRESATYAQDFLFALENYETSLKAFEMPFPEALTVAKEFAGSMPIATTNRYLFAGLLLPALGGQVAKYAKAEAELRVMRGALAIEKMRLQNSGRVPDSAADPAVQSVFSALMDPFDGRPLRYKRKTVNSYVVYSVGPDGMDDGGISTEAKPKGQKTFDLVLSVTR